MLTINNAFDDFEDWYERFTKREEREIIAAYKASLKDIKTKIADFYEKYAGTDGKLSPGAAQQYNRLEKLAAEIENEILKLSRANKNSLQKSFYELYSESYNYVGWVSEQFSGVGLRWAKLNKEAIEKAIQNPIAGLTLSETLQKNRQEILWEIRRQLVQGIVTGEPYTKTAKRLQNALEHDAAKARRVIWTESHRVKEEARQAGYEKVNSQGVKIEKVWVATLDESTRHSHRQLDGQVRDVNDFFVIPGTGLKAMQPGGFGIPSEDINCRCRTILVYNGRIPEERRARGQGIIRYQTYEEWKKAA
jgi:SPP1 gp7 family putative phage head morphogenesis protein